MSSLLNTIQNDLTNALKGGDRARVGALRFIISQIQYAQKEKQADLSDDDVIAVLTRQARGRRESIEAFASGDRADLVEKETYELDLIESYLPEQMEEAGIRDVLRDIIAAEGLRGPEDMGCLMKASMERLQGQAEGRVVSELARDELQRIAD